MQGWCNIWKSIKVIFKQTQGKKKHMIISLDAKKKKKKKSLDIIEPFYVKSPGETRNSWHIFKHNKSNI
jgi:hypothetical protein